MDYKTKPSTIIKWGEAHEEEETALTGVQISKETQYQEGRKDGFSKGLHPCCGIVKEALKCKKSVKIVLMAATCVLLVVGISGFVIMHEMLGKNIDVEFLNKANQYAAKHCNVKTINQNSSLEDVINGYWIEDFDQRENLDSYLYQMGMDWFKRSYASSVSWEDELLISIEDAKLTLNGLRGPFAEAYQYGAKLDNQTLNEMNIGDFGGLTSAITEIRDNAMFSYVFKPDSTSELFFIVSNRIDLNDVDTLNLEYKHVSSNVVWKSVFKRSCGDNKVKSNNHEDEWGEWDDDLDWK